MRSITAEELHALGLTAAAEALAATQRRYKKLVVAYEHYRYVSQDKIDAFNERLKQQTIKRIGKQGVNEYHQYDRLGFVALAAYPQVPPESVLAELQVAKERGCFGAFEIAKIESVIEHKDPILFGRVEDCPDRFVIASWDSDIRVEDLLGPTDG